MYAVARVTSHDFAIDILIDSNYLVQTGVCDMDNSAALAECYAAWIGLLDDSPVSHQRPSRVIRGFVDEILHTQFSELAAKYDDLFDSILESPTIFGVGSIIGEFVDGMKDTPIFWDYLHFRQTGDHRILTYILSFLKFIRKFEYHDDGLNRLALRKWLDNEERLSKVTLDRDVTRGLRTIIGIMTRDYRYWGLVPAFKHGPGTVSNAGKYPDAKAEGCYTAPRLLKLLRRQRMSYRFLPNTAVEFVANRDDVSELLMVPKTWKTSRSICREPVAHMYFQQMLLHNLLEALKPSFFSWFVDLQDQALNRAAAQFGSYTGLLDTIDLSSASDLVSVELVKRIFPPELLSDLLATRTSKVRLPSGQIIEVQKFAPMGSALCFPIQCIIYLSVVIYVILTTLTNGDSRLMRDLLTHCENDEEFFLSILRRNLIFGLDESPGSKILAPRIFGDDIICDYRITESVSTVLQSLGFLVNHDKSFTSSQAFRESCGGYYYNGYDVTPLYWSPWNTGYSNNLGLVSLVEMRNRLASYGYMTSASSIMHSCRMRCLQFFGDPDAIRFSSDPNASMAFFVPDIKSVRPRSAKVRHNRELCRFEEKCLCVKTKTRGSQSEAYWRQRYNLWWTATLQSTDDRSVISFRDRDGRIVSFDRRGVTWDSRVGWGWLPI